VVYDVFGLVVSDKANSALGLPAGGIRVQTDVGDGMERVLVQIWPPKNPTVWWALVNSLDVVGGIEGLVWWNECSRSRCSCPCRRLGGF
jgi:hypothetical protein